MSEALDVNKEYLQFEGRILEKEGIFYLSYTNSSVSFLAKGSGVYMEFVTDQREAVNFAGLRVYVDGAPFGEVVLDQTKKLYKMCSLPDRKPHRIKVIKITEAAMSQAGLCDILIKDGKILEETLPADERVKVEFIGDSITCGYGVLGAPDSEYDIREEDGERSYGAFMAREMNWNARYISASGYGMFVEYTGNPENNVPKLYPYINWFADREKKIEPGEFEPAFIIVNLGTNDSGFLGEKRMQERFVSAYVSFLKLLKGYHPDAGIICVLGTLCTNGFVFVKEAVTLALSAGLKDIYALELPYHDVEKDGMASGHPSVATHKKDAARILDFMAKQGMIPTRKPVG